MKKEMENTENSQNDVEEVTEKPEEKFDSYEESLKFEELSVKKRSEGEDRDLFNSTCEQIKVLMKEILQLKSDKPEEWGAQVEARKVKGLLLMMSLRKLSRIQKIRVKESRGGSSDYRQEVDGITLHLHNLLYEVSHLKKEVRKCLEFQSADNKIDLVSVKQFYSEAPDNICRRDKTEKDPHQLRLAQLHWELEQRRGQTQLSDKLTLEKEAIASAINDQETKLSSLLPRINQILEATLPLQESLNLPLEANRQQQETAQYLPAPLYTLWVQTTAYGEACEPSLKAVIKGDVEAARKLTTPEENTEVDDSDSDGDLDAQEENAQRKGRSRKERSNAEVDDSDASKLKELMGFHPLHVDISISTKENDILNMSFYYVQNMRIVTVKCSSQLKNPSVPMLTNVLKEEDLLDFLFPGDSGMESPNLSNIYQLQKLKCDGLTSDHLKSIGKPYKWAQTISGLSFTACQDPDTEKTSVLQTSQSSDEGAEDEDEVKEEQVSVVAPVRCTETLSWKLSVEHMHKTISAIRRRLQSRVILQSQLNLLETIQSTSAIPVPPKTASQLFPGKVSSNLCSWKPISWSDYESSRATQHLTSTGVVTSDWFPFKAVYQRQSVTLEAYVAISPDYPNVTPVFGLLLFWNKDYTSSTNSHVRQMESEVNTCCGELIVNPSDRFQLVSLQLYRLAMCLDILTEAGSIKFENAKAPLSQTEFHKEKIFFRPNRGPDRALPYKYLPKLGVFAQR